MGNVSLHLSKSKFLSKEYKTSENIICRMDASIKKTMAEVGRILENDFHIELNKKEKILEGYFSEGFLPEWYYYSNTPDTLAHHIYICSHSFLMQTVK